MHGKHYNSKKLLRTIEDSWGWMGRLDMIGDGWGREGDGRGKGFY
jgi:hypothetical protein